MESLILNLYGKNKQIKEYLDFFSNPNEEKLLEQYKAKVSNYMFPIKRKRAKISKAKAIIRQFSQLYKIPEIEAELMLTYITKGTEFFENRFPSKALEDSLEGMCSTFVRFVHKNDIYEQYSHIIEENESLRTAKNIVLSKSHLNGE